VADALGEFELIRRFFGDEPPRADVLLGVGDDAALLAGGGNEALAVCVDTLVSGVHFPPDAPADAIGHKALAVNLSDLAAMGARPAWALLALTLPAADEPWVAAFSRGLRALAARFGVALVGGDTTRGPLTITVTVGGYVEPARALRRAGAHPGDGIYVSGWPGEAACGLPLWLAGRAEQSEAARHLAGRLHRPEPRVALGRALRGLASAAVDVSDGLCADLGHILEASGVGAAVHATQVPLSEALRAECPHDPLRFALGGGDDYELCFTVPAAREADLAAALAGIDVPVTRIGEIEAAPGLRLYQEGGLMRVSSAGYQHFGGAAP
jgi:thiamine-monophosphate kinase